MWLMKLSSPEFELGSIIDCCVMSNKVLDLSELGFLIYKIITVMPAQKGCGNAPPCPAHSSHSTFSTIALSLPIFPQGIFYVPLSLSHVP